MGPTGGVGQPGDVGDKVSQYHVFLTLVYILLMNFKL